MLDIQSEEIISLQEAAGRLPRRRGGKRPHVATVYRWTSQGCRGIRLEVCQIGGTRCTSLEALQRFVDRLTAARGDPEPAIETAAPSRPPLSAARKQADLERSGY
jgi:hypothetical protein